MRRPPILWPCLLLPVVLGGCSTTAGTRLGSTAPSKGIAVVGSTPMPPTTGEPGSQVAAADPEPTPRRDPRARISGRVVDDRGRPVPGVTVRLADGAAKGGKDVRATTDPAGGFTLNGLRPGSSYWLVAEADDDRGPLSGRARARTADTGVEISLVSEDDAAPARGSKATRARPISKVEEADSGSPEGAAPAVNREDIGPPVGGADEPEAPAEPKERARPARPQLSAPVPAVGWRKGSSKPDAASDREAEAEAVATSTADDPQSRPRPRPAAVEEAPVEEDGPNPLPPAINPGQGADDPGPTPSASTHPRRKVSARPPKARDDSGELALAPDETEAPERPSPKPSRRPVEVASAADGPPPMPPIDGAPAGPVEVASGGGGPSLEPGPDPIPGAVAPIADRGKPGMFPPDQVPTLPGDPPEATAAPPPVATASQDAARKNPAPEPVFALPGPDASAQAEAPAEYNPFVLASSTRPAPPVVAEAASLQPSEPIPAPSDEPDRSVPPPRKKWGDLAPADRPKVVVEPTRATTSLVKRLRASTEGRDRSVAQCTYDSRLRRLVDFRLPDLEGRPVRFQDLDADLVLLDFWGTWCPPCLDAVPHLVELQKAFGPTRLQVVGIACEQAPPERRKARVEEAARRLGINYPVVLSGMDGKPCPLQQALQVQVYPTIVLVDRTGQILWRSTGETPATRDRLDRVLAALGKGETVRR